MKNIVIGASGQVARALREAFTRRGEQAIFTSSKPDSLYYLDLGNPESIAEFFTSIKWVVDNEAHVFLAGAMTHVDRCEKEQELCRAINVLGPIEVGKHCAASGYKLCFFSSEYVFGDAEYSGGAKGPFTETDPPAPSSYYGACKLEAEEALARIANLVLLVVRTTMVFSYDPDGMNFFMQLYRHMQKLEAEEAVPVFRIPVDQISTPTYAPALAAASLELMQKEQGIFHVVGSDLLSRKSFLERLAKEFGFTQQKYELGFQFLPTTSLGQTAKRPLSAGLSTEKAKRSGVRIWSLDEAFSAIRKQIEG